MSANDRLRYFPSRVACPADLLAIGPVSLFRADGRDWPWLPTPVWHQDRPHTRPGRPQSPPAATAPALGPQQVESRGPPGGDAGGGDSLASSAVIARCRKRFGSAQGLVGTTLPNPWRLRSPRTAAAIRPGRKGALLGLPSWAPLPCARSRDRTTITWQRAAEVSGQSGVSVDGSCRLPVCEHGD